ncbi:NmrA domain-containing protein [Mycena chlorophos]|uniref:NmrA domain-containing protein n=1 Tax=Mycena chlorophos TaxID=658473 RepID=A0A8H6VZA1_MYCCL|nr:NmrA domain-containing protein [Mycena chlorophos]
MSSTRMVAVFGATGQQGSAVLRALLKDGTFSPRAIARNPTSDAGKTLSAQGVEVVQGDTQDKASLVRALRGSEAVFAMTAPVMPLSNEGPNELTAGRNIVDAAKEVGVKFFIWMGMPSIKRISDGKYTQCLHYDQKEEVETYLHASGIPNASLHLGGFLENLWKFGTLKKNDVGPGYTLAIPKFQTGQYQAFTWVDRDVPQATLALLKASMDPGKLKALNGKVFPLVNACMPYSELASRIGEVLGVEVAFTTIPATGAAYRDEMFAAHAEYSGLYTATSVPNPNLVALGVKLGTIDEFLEEAVKPRFSAAA